MYVKKITCFISIALMIIILVVFGIIFKNKQLLIATNKDTCIEEQNTIGSEDIIETSQEKISQVEEIKEDLLEEQEMIEASKAITSIPTTLEKEDKPTITQYDNSNDTYSQNISIGTTKSGTDEIKVDIKQNETNIQNQETKQETVKKDTPKNIKSYVRNTTIENTMKEYMENNPSEYMQQYGFTIEPDSKIVNETNQFSYTEYRMSAKIKHKFGTIKIYAQDVFLDGVYQFTECFLL
ncbi:MAG: hypothetical protein ACLUVE_02400 [Clostridia bacterium]|jgi:hypothetical protein